MTEMGTPRVSVVVPSYNAAPFLERAIAGVRSQSLGDFEAWVIDDGSEDGTAEVAARLASDPRVRLITRAHRRISAARKKGIRRSRGRYIAFLAVDDEWVDPDKLAEGDRRAAVADARILPGRGRDGRPDAHRCDLNRPGFDFVTSTIVVRARCLDALRTLDEQLRMYEDLDLWVRLLRSYTAPRIFLRYRRLYFLPLRKGESAGNSWEAYYTVGFLPGATTIVWKHKGNTSARRADFPEDLRRVVRKNKLEVEGF